MNTTAAAQEPRIFVASVDTRSFSFEAYGQTEDKAMDALKIGLEKHKSQHPTVGKYWVTEVCGDANVREVAFGTCLRDREILTRS